MNDSSHWALIDDWWEAYVDDELVSLASADVRSLDPDWGTEAWTELDTWWDSYVDTLSAILSGPTGRRLDDTWGRGEWEKMDPWWDSYISSPSTSLASSWMRRLDENWWAREWEEIDSLWDAYADSQRQRIVKLRDLIDRMNEEWRRSPSRFDRDPLTAEWTSGGRSLGPLRITHEEDWSHWLAYLLRASSGAFTHRLFGDGFDGTPQSVNREVRFHNSGGTNRRIDILAEYESGGLSIEIKRNDTNYGKTPETAALIDEQKHGEWTHVLLLPRHKSPRLRRHFGDRVIESQDGSPAIVSANYPDVVVFHWETVSRVLRETLLAGGESDPHWTSSAYLFISLIEQHISSFEPMSPGGERSMAAEETADSASLTALQRLTIADITEQLAHFERTLEVHNE